MQLKTKKTENIIGDREENTFRIGEDAHSIIINSLINLYENPIGSVVREITSNCVDAHRERDLKVMGKLSMDDEDNQEYFSTRNSVEIEYLPGNELLNIKESFVFKDWGVGLSKDRVKEIYTVFGNSTKRDANDQIGGFGIGAKSPFAYTETFYITTRRNGIKYTYLLTRGNEFPSMDLIHEEETKDINGTEIIVPLVDSYDKSTFLSEIHSQLAYFPNIYYSNMEQIGKVYEPKIIEETDEYLIDANMKHPGILIDNVQYQLNTAIMSAIPNDVGLVLKFKIGELELIPSRETILYSADTKELISERFNKLLTEFLQEVENDLNTEDDFLTFLLKADVILKGSHYNQRNRQYAYYNSRSRHRYYGANDDKEDELDNEEQNKIKVFQSKCKLLSEQKILKNKSFRYKGEKITQERISYFALGFSFMKVTYEGTNASKMTVKQEEFFNAMSEQEKLYYVPDKTNRAIDMKLFTLHNNYFIRFKVPGLLYNNQISNSANYNWNFIEARKVKAAQKVFERLLPHFLNSKRIINYDSVPPLDGIKSAISKTDWSELRKQNKEIFYRYLRFSAADEDYGRRQKDTGWTNAEIKIQDLEKKKNIIFGFTNDSDKLDLFKHIFSPTHSPNVATVWKVALPLKKFFRDCTYVDDFFTPENPVLRKQLTLYHIFNNLKSENVDFLFNFGFFNPKMAARFNYFRRRFKDTLPNYSSGQIDTILKLSNSKLEDFVIPEAVTQYQKILNYSKDIELLNYIDELPETGRSYYSRYRRNYETDIEEFEKNRIIDFLKLKNKMKQKTKLNFKSDGD